MKTNSPQAVISGQTASEEHSRISSIALGLVLVLVNSFTNWDMKGTQVKTVQGGKKKPVNVKQTHYIWNSEVFSCQILFSLP